MGWVILLSLVVGGVALMWLLGVRGGPLKAVVAALLVGASGYAFQGRPDLPGAPGQGSSVHETLPLTDARHAFFGQFTSAESWLRISEALARGGSSADSVGVLQNAVRRYPGDAQLWIGLGNALVDHAHGLTPPAELAYRRAAEVAPGQPAPAFFLGVAKARSGDPAGAVALWKQILATAPANAGWRPLVEAGIAAFDRSPDHAATGS